MGGDIGRGIGDLIVALAILVGVVVPSLIGALVAVAALVFTGSRWFALGALIVGCLLGVILGGWIKRQA